MAYSDLASIHNPSTGASPPPAWGDQVNDNSAYLYLRGPYICTSSTRPGSPFEGQRITETDTDRSWRYSGAAWRLESGPMPRAQAKGGSAQGIVHNTEAQLSWAAGEDYDTDSLMVGGLFSCPSTLPGLWLFTWGVVWSAPGVSAGLTTTWLQHSLGTRKYGQQTDNNTTTYAPMHNGSAVLSVSSAETVQVRVYQNCTATVNVNTDANAHFQAVYLGPTT